MGSLKSFLLKLYQFPFLSKEATNVNQKRIRDVEWAAVVPFIRPGMFLDVGCGAGYAMQRARELGLTSYGIDPSPGAHGVGRDGSNYSLEAMEIRQAYAESIPFSDAHFDVLYSSHVLEHVQSVDGSLKEMARVLKPDGVLIIGMPTACMALIGWFGLLLMTTPHRIINAFLGRWISTGKGSVKNILFTPSHSVEGATVLHDLRYYRVSNWKKLIAPHFEIEHVLLPALYPYPEYRQWMPFLRNAVWGSSVFFICRQKNRVA